MAKVKVIYTATFTQTLIWPDDELDSFNYENLEANLDPEGTNSNFTGEVSVYDILLNGREHYF